MIMSLAVLHYLLFPKDVCLPKVAIIKQNTAKMLQRSWAFVLYFGSDLRGGDFVGLKGFPEDPKNDQILGWIQPLLQYFLVFPPLKSPVFHLYKPCRGKVRLADKALLLSMKPAYLRRWCKMWESQTQSLWNRTSEKEHLGTEPAALLKYLAQFPFTNISCWSAGSAPLLMFCMLLFLHSFINCFKIV